MPRCQRRNGLALRLVPSESDEQGLGGTSHTRPARTSNASLADRRHRLTGGAGPRRAACQSRCGAAVRPSPQPAALEVSTSRAFPRAPAISALSFLSGSSSPNHRRRLAGIANNCASGPCASSASDRSASDCSRAVVCAQLSGPTPTYGWPGVEPQRTNTTLAADRFQVVLVRGPVGGHTDSPGRRIVRCLPNARMTPV